jgi:hypothetical protein
MLDFLINLNNIQPELSSVFITKPTIPFVEKSANDIKLLFWGDPIFEPNFILPKPNNDTESFVKSIIQQVQGHYYFLYYNKVSEIFCMGNSLFSILPVYYSLQQNNIWLASSPEIIAEQLSLKEPDKGFILENILFNYPLTNRSPFKGISLLASNHFIIWRNNKPEFKRHTNFDSWFNLTSDKSKTPDYFADLFLERSALYFPKEKYIHALTGGFDGRTLVSCALHHKKSFETYSFGSADSSDVPVARQLSDYANIKFNEFRLDEEYVKNESLSSGLEFVSNSAGTASFARSHYLYAAKTLSEKTNYLITGNFGSELFRAAHIAGAVITQNLYNICIAKDPTEARVLIENSKEFNFLQKDEFIQEWKELCDELEDLLVFSSEYKKLSLNQKFYIIVFEEVFRKYFGAEMKNQHKYLFNRTPFLDFQFVGEILQSPWAGVYSDFFEHNPLKRFKGQVIYAHIIKKSFPDFSKIPMDKGYCPEDLLSFKGKLKITANHLKKRKNKLHSKPKDPFAVQKSFINNKDAYQKLTENTAFLNNQLISEGFQSNRTDHSFFIALSQAIYFNQFFS